MVWLILVVVALVIFVSFIIAYSTTPAGKGRVGEKRVGRVLSQLDSSAYKIVNDALFATSKGGTSQIDHLVVSLYGIFVIETKNYGGWIFGDERNESWTQVIYNEKTQFRNPIKQNWSHVYALKEILHEFSGVPFIPIVVFAGNAQLKEIKSSSPVVYLTQLLTTIQSNSQTQCLSADEVNRIVELLHAQNRGGRTAAKEHIKQVQKQRLDEQRKKKELVCPKCNNTLVLRKGTHGEFYGCSAYPRCRFTMPKKTR